MLFARLLDDYRRPIDPSWDATFSKTHHHFIAMVADIDQEGLHLLSEPRYLSFFRNVTTVEDDDSVAGMLDVSHQVRREQDADTEVPAGPSDQGQHLLTSCRIEPRGRLI